jgi:trehalose 6-phosphate synthase/phosphatase
MNTASTSIDTGTHDRVAVRRGAPKAPRLLVMSNRAPVRVVRENGKSHVEQTVGGVGSTFLRLLHRSGGVWIAWSEGKNQPLRIEMPPDNPHFTMCFTRLSERDVSDYYYGACNQALWPLMHFMTQNCSFDGKQWASYCRVNEIFAKAAEAELSSCDCVWVQDFHLALVPRMLRENGRRLPIGIFWHVPWPPEQVFRVLPWRSDLLRGMLGSDLIGFHTPMYVKHFLDACERILGLRVDRVNGVVFHDSAATRVGAFPLGIAVDDFRNLSMSAPVRARARRIHKSLRTPIVVLSVDRLDYTKGIEERLLGFERFLELHPDYRGKVTLVLIAVPSRTRVAEYAALKRRLDELVGRMVGRFSFGGWVPIRYLYTQFSTEELVAYYQAADIALVTPLRDGMNLVAKEYVVSHLGEGGVLILSEFAGAAQELKSALQVNPYDIDQIADALYKAMEMPIEERHHRMAQMRRSIESNDLLSWAENFIGALMKNRRIQIDAGLSPN